MLGWKQNQWHYFNNYLYKMIKAHLLGLTCYITPYIFKRGTWKVWICFENRFYTLLFPGGEYHYSNNNNSSFIWLKELNLPFKRHSYCFLAFWLKSSVKGILYVDLCFLCYTLHIQYNFSLFLFSTRFLCMFLEHGQIYHIGKKILEAGWGWLKLVLSPL